MKTLSNEEVAGSLKKDLKNWTYENNAIKRDFKFKTFVEAFSFMTSIALEVEKVDHHPNWSNSYNIVNIALSTHSAKGVTKKDLELAEMIDNTYKKYA